MMKSRDRELPKEFAKWVSKKQKVIIDDALTTKVELVNNIWLQP